MSEKVYGGGGPNGNRVWWPAGLQEMRPADRARALERGWWPAGDDGWIVTRDGRRYRSPGEARRLRESEKR